ncbi:Dot/Icm T4SS effector AnkY/LegA9 [Legionella pneumophila]|uniref:Dot/Icm T4SS effector AnkY/LegA9 n=1 Tax=Legionella pneumophila TaxID=446 RepID=UPI0009B4CD7C|nr:Dot/Icm T4SS effector AnkY/LegA9 [Legionella pneumophila]
MHSLYLGVVKVMAKIILEYANCVNSTAKGDFALAGQIAKDLVREKTSDDIDVVLTSTLDGIARFESLYGKAVDGRVIIEGTSVGLCALELFESVDNEVVAFIEANRCKYAPSDILKRVLSPDSKFLFIGAANQKAIATGDKFTKSWLYISHKGDQPNVYEHFDEDDSLIQSVGLGDDRLGLPSLPKVDELPEMNSTQSQKIPSGEYGFMYLAAVHGIDDVYLMNQYMSLTEMGQYVLVGEYAKQSKEVQMVLHSLQYKGSSVSLTMPQIFFHDSVDNCLMRNMVSKSSGPLVVSTGVMSSIEAMQDGKLTYYQTMSNNTQFVASYLIAVKSICSSDTTLFGSMPKLIIDLSNLLFAEKPLKESQMKEIKSLLGMSSVTSRLGEMNKRIIAKANGTVAGELLSFIGKPKTTQSHKQCISVCMSLRKSGETTSPIFDQALRRAAAWGRLFELKVLIASMSTSDLNKKDKTGNQYTALHWAVMQGHLDCARLLVKSGASVDIQDKSGKSPLHYAIKRGDKETIKLLVQAGASLEIMDDSGAKPCDGSESWVPEYIKSCYEKSGHKSSSLF